MGSILWTKHFLAEQGYDYEQILHQDNMITMLLESDGHKSTGKCSHHINIRYFFISDMKERGQFSIRYCLTDKLVADYMTKPLHGLKFKEFRQQITNLNMCIFVTLLRRSYLSRSNYQTASEDE